MEKALKPDHPDVAVYLNNIAKLHRIQGRYSEAETLFRQAIAIEEKTYGKSHPKIVASQE